MNVLYAVRKSDETNQLLKNGQDNKNTCDAMDGITYVSISCKKNKVVIFLNTCYKHRHVCNLISFNHGSM